MFLQDFPATLIAVSKQQPEERIVAALAAGQRIFGENRVQEAIDRWSHRRESIDLHLIGPLQTNKVRAALAFFDCIHTIDRKDLIHALKKEMAKSSNPCTRQFFVQVNTGAEPQKAGVLPQDLPELLALCEGLPVTGLMCIPPMEDPPELHFALLKTLAEVHHLPHLSMGMSADYKAALDLGATHIRLGRAFFGERLHDDCGVYQST